MEKASKCGCYYCEKVYSPTKVTEWCDGEKTPICPKCGMDSVVPYDESIDESPENFKEQLKVWNKESFS